MTEPILTPAQMRAIRTDLEATQAVFALAMGYCRRYYQMLEEGKRPMHDYNCDRFFSAVDTLKAARAKRLARRDAHLADLPRAS